jgi:hypothetical protein
MNRKKRVNKGVRQKDRISSSRLLLWDVQEEFLVKKRILKKGYVSSISGVC